MKFTKIKQQLGRESGFTLVEMIIIIGIIGVLSTIAIPALQDMNARYKAKGAARQVFSDLQMARLNAMKSKGKWQVKFTGNEYRIIDNTGSVIKSFDIGASYRGITIDSTGLGGNAQFNASGTAKSGNVVIFNTLRSHKLCINSNTGNIRITSGTSAC